MEDIILNYKDVQFLTGIERIKAKEAIYNTLPSSYWEDLNVKGGQDIKVRHTVSANKIKLFFCSPHSEMDKQKVIPYTIKRIQRLGLSENIKRDILENESCVLREDICGEYATLKKILPNEDIEAIKAMLRRRK